MASSEDDDLEFNELDALQAELDALKRALGNSYQQLEGPTDNDSGLEHIEIVEEWSRDGEDTEGVKDAPLPPSPFVTLNRQGAFWQQGKAAWGGAAIGVRAALDANRRLQAQLQRLLRSVDRAIDRNADMLAHIKALDSKKVIALAGAQKGGSLPSGGVTSWFWQVDGQPPPPHPDALQLAPVSEVLPLAFKRVPWSEEERRKLAEGVLQMVQEVRLDAALGELQALVEAGGSVTLADYEARSKAVGELTLEAAEVVAEADQLSVAHWGVLIQRAQLAERTPLEAQTQWRNSARPALAHGPFTSEEDAVLLAAVERLGMRQWAAVSRELSGRRTPLACLARHRELLLERAAEERTAGAGLAAELDKGEMERLEALVQEHNAQWKIIAKAFGMGWSGYQLMHVWRRKQQRLAGSAVGAEGQEGAQPVAPRRGRWTPKEDDLLLKAMAVHQRKWSKISQLVPGRSDVQCRERFMNVLNPDIRQHEPWSREEDIQLAELVPQHTREGTGRVKWSAVAAQLAGRTDKQCALRWQRLQSGDIDEPVRRAPKRKKHPATAGRGGRGRGRGAGGVRAEGRAAGSGSDSLAEPPAAAETGGEVEWQGEAVGQLPPGAKAGSRADEGQGWEMVQQKGVPIAEREQPTVGSQPKRRCKQQALLEPAIGSESNAMASKQESKGELEGDASTASGKEGAADEGTETNGEGEGAARGQRPLGRQRRAARAAAAAWREGEPVQQRQQQQQQRAKAMPSPPEPTTSCMPCTRKEAVGRSVKVFWLIDDVTGLGKLYVGKVTAFSPKTGKHTIKYASRPEEHILEEENLVWGSGEVTGPGASWPEDAQADIKVQQEQQQRQQQLQEELKGEELQQTAAK